MDPFVVITFGKKAFRTRVIRHNLSPTWDEKIMFHVRKAELETQKINISVLDWDKYASYVLPRDQAQI
jgi:phosphatidylserine decarboxylase